MISSHFLNQRGEPYLSYFPPPLVLNNCLFAPIPFNNDMIEAGLKRCFLIPDGISPHHLPSSCFYLPVTNFFDDYYLNFLHNILQTGGGGCLKS